jgi:hypothetical protein
MASDSLPANDVDQLLLNARLRDEIEPFRDDSLSLLESTRLPTPVENRFLEEMLAWERAPALPISKWFEPELRLPPPELLESDSLSKLLHETIDRLFNARVVLECTDHLSDLELYRLIRGAILPSCEKKVDLATAYLRWHCLDADTDEEIWLQYYASDEEREAWAEGHERSLPPRSIAPFPRDLPDAP